jgi:chromosome segregation ATPase
MTTTETPSLTPTMDALSAAMSAALNAIRDVSQAAQQVRHALAHEEQRLAQLRERNTQLDAEIARKAEPLKTLARIQAEHHRVSA